MAFTPYNPYQTQPQQPAGTRQITAGLTNPADGSGGFKFSLNSSSGGGSTPQAPTAYGGGGYGGSASGLDSRIANGQYGSAQEITNAQNAAMTQSRTLAGQQALAKQQAQAQMDMQRAQFAHQDQMRQNIMGQLEAVSTWGTNAPPMPRIQVQNMPMGSSVPNVQHVGMPDLTAAQNAAFARAKDREGQLAQGALTGLRSSLGGRGLLGSGSELRGTQNIANRGLANLGEVNREQAIQSGNAMMDQMKMGYQGDITQRAQDIAQAGQANAQNLRLAELQWQADMAEREGVMRHNERGQDFMQNLLLGLVKAY